MTSSQRDFMLRSPNPPDTIRTVTYRVAAIADPGAAARDRQSTDFPLSRALVCFQRRVFKPFLPPGMSRSLGG
jgi:hypothetical protein